MNKSLRSSLLAAMIAITISITAVAESLSSETMRDKMLVCRKLPLTTNRVICYDDIANMLATETPSKNENSAPKRSASPEHLFGLDLAARQVLINENTDRQDIDEIRSRVLKVKRSLQSTVTVYLENGQVWREKKGRKKWRIKPGDTAVISRASMGSFRMKLAGKNKSVAAKRLK